MRASFSGILACLAALSPAHVLAQYGSVSFTSSGFYAHQSQGSATVSVKGTSQSVASASIIFVHGTNSAYPPSSTAILYTDYTTNSIFVPYYGEGEGTASVTNDNNTVSFQIPLLVDPNLGTSRTIVLGFYSTFSTLASPTNCTITLLPDPLVTLTCPEPVASQNGPTTGEFTVTRYGETLDAITVNFSTSGTGVYGTDYTLTGTGVTSSNVVIPAGQTNATVTVSPVVNSTPGPNKTVTLTLTTGTFTTNEQSVATVTILNKNPYVSISGTSTNASEGGVSGLFTFSRTADPSPPLTIFYTVSGTAQNGVDYAYLTNQLTIPSGETYGTITVAPTGSILTNSPATVTLTLVPTNSYTLAAPTNATVWITNYNDNARPLPNNNYALDPTAHNGWFYRGTGLNRSDWSIVIPTDLQKGVPLDNIGGNGSSLFPSNSWTTLSHFNATNSGWFSFQNPIASFGARVGGSPLYYGQDYTFGVYAGDPSPVAYTNANSYTNAIRIQIYQSGTMTPVGTTVISIPNPSNTNGWAAFITNGYAQTNTGFGLTTILTFDQPDILPWDLDPNVSSNDYAYHLVENATYTGTNYVYMVELAGGISNGWMVVDSNSVRSWSRLYTMEFESLPPWQATIVDEPAFQGVPMPPSYLGMSPDELAVYSPPVTNGVTLSPSTCTNLDLSPELRRHPILDQFVADMGNDPMLLANYVINEIELTDAIDYSDSGSVSEIAVNPGGVSRGALGVFLEKQGSPAEQCALLIYLLRQAGVPACYVFPPHNGLLMVDSRLSTLLRMQIRGALSEGGSTYTTNTLIPVNYPWVAAYIGTNWVNIFPWLKDTEVSEGFDLNEYLPPPYNTPYAWARAYLYGATNILDLSTEDDTPLTLYPLWLQQTLNQSLPGMSLSDFGMNFRNRPQYRSRWSDFPTPTYVTNSGSIAVESLGSTQITNVNPAFTNIFDTISVQVQSVANPSITVSSGELNFAELNDRRFLIRHSFVNSNTTELILSLAPFRTNITTVLPFSSVATQSFPQNTNAICYLLSSNTLGATDDQLQVTIVHKWHRSLPSGFSIPDPDLVYLGYESPLVITNIRTMRKGDFGAICLSMGRVTTDMLNVQAQDLWQMEQQIAANPSITNSLSPDQYQGDPLYLMGMSYFSKCDAFREFTAPLFKANILRFHASGLAGLAAKHNPDGTLPGGQIILDQPKVDMFYEEMGVAESGNYDAESGDTDYNQSDRWFQLAIVAFSAEEHAILNKFFSMSDSVSTVKLLRLALTETTNGILDLNRFNYVAQGNIDYPTGSTNKLMNYVPSMWASVTNAFTTAYSSNNVEVFITPGPIRNLSDSYQGMGALILTPGNYSAIIGSNDLNGGYGENMPDQSFTAGNLTQSILNQDQNGDYSYQTTAGTASAPVLVSAPSEPWNTGNNVSQINSGAEQLDPTQQAELGTFQAEMGDPSSSSGTLYQDVADSGALTQTVKPNSEEQVYDPVNAIAGDFYVDEADLNVAGPFPMQVRRNYSSQNLFDGGIGYGWKLCYFPYLSLNLGTNTINCAEVDGTVITYRQNATNSNLYQAQIQDNPRLQNSVGSIFNRLNGTITLSVVGGVTNYTMKGADGSQRVFIVQSFPISTVNRTRPYLTSWTDTRGNFLRFYYGTNSLDTDYGQINRVEANNGNFLSLQYDQFTHVTDIYSGDARQVHYDYDIYGDLVTVTRPDATQVNYTYQHSNYASNTLVQLYSTHLLIDELKPDGRTVENVYDSQRRVVQQSATVGYDLRLVVNASFVFSNNFNLTNYWTNGITGYTLVSDCFSNVTRYDYTNSLMDKVTDPLNRVTVQSWYATNDGMGGYPNSLKTSTDPRGLVTTRMYDTLGNMTNVTLTGDITGMSNTNETAVMTMTYNTNLLVTSIIDPVGNQTVYTYTNPAYPYLRTTEGHYASNGTQISLTVNTYYNVTNAPPADFTNFVGSFGLLEQVVRASGTGDAATNVYLSDVNGFPAQQTLYTGTTDPAVTTTYFYNLQGEMVESQDAVGRSNLYTYDGCGRLESHDVLDESGNQVSFETLYYSDNGDLTWTDDPLSDPDNSVWFDYDGAGRKVQEVHWQAQAAPDGSGVQAPDGDALYATSFFEYDPFGNLIKTIDPLGNYSRMQYDPVGELTQKVDFDANTGLALATNGFGYEPGGLVAYATNAVGGVTTKLYTSTGKPMFQSNPDGSTNGWTYYPDGRLRREYQRNGAYYETTYNDANLTTTRIFYTSAGSPLATNSVVLDHRGNVAQIVDAAGNTFTNIFDGLDRVKISAGPAIVSISGSTNLPPGPGGGGGITTNIVQQSSTNFYDASENFTTNVNALGQQTVTARDALNRATNISFYNSAGGTAVRVRQILYSNDQHTVTTWEGTGTGAIPSVAGLDNDGRTVVTFRYPDYPTIDLVEFTTQNFDLAGNLTNQEQCSWSNYIVTVWSTNSSTFDGLYRKISEVNRDGATATFGYDGLGDLTNRSMPGGLTWSATYNSAGQILAENDSSGAQSTRHFTYAYYPSGNQWAGLRDTVTDDRSVVQTSSYDDYLRVASLGCTGPLPAQQLSCSWQYDPRGLLTNISQSFATNTTGPSTVIARSFDAYSELSDETVSLNGGSLTAVGQGWDSAGRRAATAGMGFQYRADGLMASVNGTTFGYGNNGLLTGSTNGIRAMIVTQRDGAGRPLQATTAVNLSTVLTETWNWTPDGLPASYTAARDFTDSRQFSYGTATRRLTQESLNLSSGQSITNNYTFDSGMAGGLGVLTQAGETSSQPGGTWSGGEDAYSRVSTETNTVLHRTASGGVNGRATLRGYLNGQTLDVRYDPYTASAWTADMPLLPGTNTLAVYADHPSGLFTTNCSSTFTVPNGAFDNETSLYDGAGNVTNRTWKNALGQTTKSQTLTWDAFGQLVNVTEHDTNNNGFNLESDFDGLGRQVRTIETTVTNNIALATNPAPVVVVYTFDPAVEFLIEGMNTSQGAVSRQDILAYGPDLSGVYGGMQGVGGLDAIVSSTGSLTSTFPVVNDAFGNVIGAVTNGAMAWNPSRLNLYGPVDGYAPPRVSLGTPIYESLAWRTRSLNAAGLFQLGKRPYDYTRRAFLSADPLGHASDWDLNTAFAGNPASFFDPDGRLSSQFSQNSSGNEPFWYGLNPMIVQANALVYGNQFDPNQQGVGAYFDNYNTSSETGAYVMGFAGAMVDELDAMTSSSTYANGLSSYGHNINEYYQDGGWLPAASYAATSWNMGSVYSGAANFDLNYDTAGQPVGDFYQRGAVFSSGVASTAGIMSAGLSAAAKLGIVAPTMAPTSLPVAAESGIQTLDASAIRFSQSSVNNVGAVADSMAANGWQGAPVTVVRMADGSLTTVDNTRVLAASLTGTPVQATIMDAGATIDASQAIRFVGPNENLPTTWGDAVLNRIGNQNNLFRTTYPSGSPFTGVSSW